MTRTRLINLVSLAIRPVARKLRRRHHALLKSRTPADHAEIKNFCDELKKIRNIVPKIRTVIDVGAHRGCFSRAALEVFSPESILAFEPNTDLHQYIRANCATADIFPLALGCSTGIRTLYKHKEPSMSSLLEATSEFDKFHPWDPTGSVDRVAINVKSLDSFVDDKQLAESETLLKLDTQGTELDVLMSCSDRLYACSVIIVEHMFWSGYIGQQSFAELVSYLDMKRFQLSMVLNMRFRRTGEPAWADFVFVRRS